MALTLTRATKVVDLCVNLALKAEHDRAVAALAEVRRADEVDPRETSTAVAEAAAAVRALEEQMRDHTVQFTLQALPRKQWAEFTLANPPRPGDKTDEAVGLNVSRLDEVIVASIVEVRSRSGELVPFAPAADWAPLADEMSNAQWEAFSLGVLALNNGATSAPFSPAASLAILRSEQTLKRPNASE